MVVEFLVAVSLPVWLGVEEIARLRARRERAVADHEPAVRTSPRDAVAPAKA